ncbi:sn-glycerol-3-phosphate ABC transporter ATP-binding protein UgpC [soil metagenome]
MAAISLNDVTKVFDDGTVAVKGVNLDIADGEFIVFVGPSGCGKSTLLRMISGLEPITSGEIRIGGKVINNVPPRDRNIAMVFQNYALYPHMTARQNIGFALEQRRIPKVEIERRVNEAARILDLTALLNRKPKQLSGGQRQRVAMGRAIVREPDVFLLDEPLSNLDAKFRVQMRAELGRLHARLRVTTIHVTHDQIEAMTLGNRVAVFSRGTLQQYDSPHALYNNPVNVFVAGFIGSPAMNFIEATATPGGGSPAVLVGGSTVSFENAARRIGISPEEKVLIGIRPEHIKWQPSKEPAPGFLRAQVDLVEHLEPESFVVATIADTGAVLRSADDFLDQGARDELAVTQMNARSITLRVNAERVPERGSFIDIALDSERTHVFDPATGLKREAACATS